MGLFDSLRSSVLGTQPSKRQGTAEGRSLVTDYTPLIQEEYLPAQIASKIEYAIQLDGGDQNLTSVLYIDSSDKIKTSYEFILNYNYTKALQLQFTLNLDASDYFRAESQQEMGKTGDANRIPDNRVRFTDITELNIYNKYSEYFNSATVENINKVLSWALVQANTR